MRITKQMIEAKMRTLNAVLKRPATQWDEGAKSGEMNIGHLTLDSNGYGMRLVEICSPGGAERAWSDCFDGNRQMFDYLVGVLNGITLRNELIIRESNGGHFS
jgi:hypothetical protein